MEYSQETEKIRKLAFKLVGKELQHKVGAHMPFRSARILAQDLGVSNACVRNLFAGIEPGLQTRIILGHLFRLHKLSD